MFMIMVITMNEERKLFMKTQLEELQIEVPVFFIDATTPANSPNYLDHSMVMTKGAEKYFFGQQCCTRSHVLCAKRFIEEFPHVPYLLVLEDDVCILKTGFVEEIKKVAAIYESNSDLGYLSVGYFPPLTDDCSDIQHNFEKHFVHDKNVYWRMEKTRPRIFGTQGCFYNQVAAKKLCDVLDKPTAALALKSLDEHIRVNEVYSDMDAFIHADTALNIVLRHGMVWPPLVVESPSMESNIWEPNRQTRERQFCDNIRDQLDFTKYYTF